MAEEIINQSIRFFIIRLRLYLELQVRRGGACRVLDGVSLH